MDSKDDPRGRSRSRGDHGGSVADEHAMPGEPMLMMARDHYGAFRWVQAPIRQAAAPEPARQGSRASRAAAVGTAGAGTGAVSVMALRDDRAPALSDYAIIGDMLAAKRAGLMGRLPPRRITERMLDSLSVRRSEGAERRGPFDAKARPHSVQWWRRTHRGVLAAVGGLAAGLAGLAGARDVNGAWEG